MFKRNQLNCHLLGFHTIFYSKEQPDCDSCLDLENTSVTCDMV